MLVIKAEIHKMLVRKANIRLLLHKQSDLVCSVCLSSALFFLFWQVTSVQKLRTFTVSTGIQGSYKNEIKLQINQI